MKALILFLGIAVAAFTLALCLVDNCETPEQQLERFHTQTLRRVRIERSIDSLEFAIRLEVAARSPQLFDSQNGKR
jgi:hypothetical protein